MDLYGLYFDLIAARMDAERAHDLTLRGLATARRLPGWKLALGQWAPEVDERLRQRVWGLPFANPLGLAAGTDKNAVAVEPFLALGFSHVEVGTVTLRPQAGNERPRLWRARDQRAVVNALGFPNAGAAEIHNRLAPLRPAGIVGVNIGKNKETPDEQAAEEYADLVRAIWPVAQYITINVSSPNTPGLRALQLGDQLKAILQAAGEANASMAGLMDRKPRPVLVKIAPDLTDEQIEAVAGTALEVGANGIIATNTTTSRDGLPERFRELPGGMSGAPLRDRALEVTRRVYRTVGREIPVIGVGGIGSGADAIARMRAGATLVQLYTALIYEGPSLPGRIVSQMSADADAEGWQSVSELIGIDA